VLVAPDSSNRDSDVVLAIFTVYTKPLRRGQAQRTSGLHCQHISDSSSFGVGITWCVPIAAEASYFHLLVGMASQD
jgi:hypothetical protein